MIIRDPTSHDKRPSLRIMRNLSRHKREFVSYEFFKLWSSGKITSSKYIRYKNILRRLKHSQ